MSDDFSVSGMNFYGVRNPDITSKGTMPPEHFNVFAFVII